MKNCPNGNDRFPKKMSPQNNNVILKDQASTKRVVIYARISTADQQLEGQMTQLRQYADQQGWHVVEVISDVESGGKGPDCRSGLNRVFELAHRRKFDLLLFWALDRLSREGTRKTISYLTRLEECGVHWHSHTEPYVSSCGLFADAVVAILASLANQEKVRISERTKAGLQNARANGKRLGRPKTPEGRITEARQLRTAGLTFNEIGKRMGVSQVRAFQLVNTR
jgi:DNA invertase Pin-like site-specific DNA recombinase